MKAADISDVDFLAALDAVIERRGCWASRWDIEWELSGHAPDLMFQAELPLRYPSKVVLAKAKSMVKRGVITGCACGCRGDFERVKGAGR